MGQTTPGPEALSAEGLDRELIAKQVASLENWAKEMDRSAKAMSALGLTDAVTGNKRLADELRHASRTIMRLARPAPAATEEAQTRAEAADGWMTRAIYAEAKLKVLTDGAEAICAALADIKACDADQQAAP